MFNHKKIKTMKRIQIMLICFLAFSATSYATNFEGIIKQQFTLTNGQSLLMQWYFTPQNFALEMISGEDVFHFTPTAKGILMYSNIASEDGTKHYSLIASDKISSSLTQDLNIAIQNGKKSIIKEDINTQEIYLSGDANGSITTAENIFDNTDLILSVLKDHYALIVQKQKGIKGFPLNAKLAIKEVGNLSIETISIERKAIDKSVFAIPAGYKELPTAVIQQK